MIQHICQSHPNPESSSPSFSEPILVSPACPRLMATLTFLHVCVQSKTVVRLSGLIANILILHLQLVLHTSSDG